jgi:hypothetical protein
MTLHVSEFAGGEREAPGRVLSAGEGGNACVPSGDVERAYQE